MSQIDEVLDALSNGKWHDLKKISEETGLHQNTVDLLTNFLAKYEFVELNKKERKTRLTPSLFNFLRKIQNLEEKEI